jgi:hypothetical protein
LHNSCFQLFLSTLAVLIVFIIGLLNDSAWEFARGYDGATRRSLNPMKGITKPCDIQIGNSVLKKTDRKENKLTPAYEPNPYTE